MELFEALHTRRSVKKLVEPAPTAEQLETIFKAAVLAPDHTQLGPWRFIVIEGDGLVKLGELAADSVKQINPNVDESKLDKERRKPLRAPMVVAVAATHLDTTIDFSELVNATSAAVQNMLLAAHGLGIGAIWRSGPILFNRHYKEGLGLEADDELVALVYLGTPANQPDAREPQLGGVVRHWP